MRFHSVAFFLKHIIFYLLFSGLSVHQLRAQSSKSNQIRPSKREIIWGITHPLIVYKVHKISIIAYQISDSLAQNNILAGASGGYLDAFKHCFWMALLAQQIGAHRALRLGVIHENLNYWRFRRTKIGAHSILSWMDLKNNELGLQLAKSVPQNSQQELITLILKTVQSGKAWVVEVDSLGSFLKSQNQQLRWIPPSP
jgi:hypothetical protein